jgi:hypothetical protein
MGHQTQLRRLQFVILPSGAKVSMWRMASFDDTMILPKLRFSPRSTLVVLLHPFSTSFLDNP